MSRVVQELLKCPLFTDADPSELDAIAQQATKVTLAEKQTLFMRGDPGDCVYLLLDGAIRITVLSSDGREVLFSLIEPVHLFGEIAVLDGGPRTANAIAMKPSQLLSISSASLHSYLQRKPDRYRKLMSVLCQRIRVADQLIEDLLFLSTRSRLAKHLHDLGGKVGERKDEHVTVRVSQQDLADNLGVSRELVNKILSRWDSAGLITLNRGRISFDMSALAYELDET